jgi:hypothetical protein
MPVDGQGITRRVRHPRGCCTRRGSTGWNRKERRDKYRAGAVGDPGRGDRRDRLGGFRGNRGDLSEWDLENSAPFYVIESAHAVAETAMVPALVWLWKAVAARLRAVTAYPDCSTSRIWSRTPPAASYAACAPGGHMMLKHRSRVGMSRLRRRAGARLVPR